MPESSSASDLSSLSSDECYIKAEPSAKAARLSASSFNWGDSRPSFAKCAPSDWSPQDSAALYNLSGWGAPYFSVNAAGNLLVTPAGAVGRRRALMVCCCAGL